MDDVRTTTNPAAVATLYTCMHGWILMSCMNRPSFVVRVALLLLETPVMQSTSSFSHGSSFFKCSIS